jgi:hypothetical protein
MNSRQQEGLGKIICGGIMIYFGLPLYIHGMPLDKIGLIFLLLGLIFIVFGFKNLFYKVSQNGGSYRNENFYLWLLLGLILIATGIFIVLKIHSTQGCSWGGGLDPWCNVDWFFLPLITVSLGLFISSIAIVKKL